jgi:hypothetical protein
LIRDHLPGKRAGGDPLTEQDAACLVVINLLV